MACRSARPALLITLALLGATPPASGQTSSAAGSSQGGGAADGASVEPDMRTGTIEAGVRISDGLGRVGRFQRFTDPRSGPTLDRLRYRRARETWQFVAAFDHVGYRDQRYRVSMERYGTLSASFEWNQVPLLFSGVSRSPFTESSPGVFRLDDSVQLGIEARTATLDDYQSTLRLLDTRARRDVAEGRLRYAVTQALDLHLVYRNTARHGGQPWGAPFGLNNATEVPLTLDQRTHDLTTAAEWSPGRGTVRVAYDGSWFRNDVETLVWDNPIRLTDRQLAGGNVSGDASSQGRMALWPDSSSHTVSVAGSLALPARTRAFASASVGSWLQDAQLLPFTVNTAIAPITLPRPTAEAEARISSMTYRVTSRPSSIVWLSAQYRLYDYDNRTPRFPVGQYVRVDAVPAVSRTGGSEPFEYTRHFVDVDASVTPLPFFALRGGYGQEQDNRSYRFFEETTERIVRGSIDSTGFSWGAVRLQYDRAVRTGEGLDEQVFSDIGEQVSLRQFDISDRTRDRVSLMLQATPWNAVGVHATGAVGLEHRPDASFGLQDNDLRSITLGVDVVPAEAFGAGLSYGFENYRTLQRSRQADPGTQFNDPTRDWETDMEEDVHTWSATVDVRPRTGRLSLAGAYDYVRSSARYLYLLPPNSSLPAPQQLPDVRNAYHRATADVRYALTPRVAIGVGYELDTYHVRDFARSPDVLTTPLLPAFVNLLYQWRPYDVHAGSLRLIYGW
jgi:MtrB/PioB family decaheme-associated outer membrane protein